MIDQSMEKFAVEIQDEFKSLLKELCVIPAPSHHEDKRVAFVTEWFKKQGMTDVHTDEAKNVIWSLNDTGDNDLTVFMAHTDVVFPDTDPLPFYESEGKYHCPGITDDTAPLCVLLLCARYFFRNNMKPKTGILIVANSCEEGLGNLKGSRCIVDTYGDRIKEFITVESNPTRVTNRAVGSHRYKVTVETEGGHSFSKFGNRNAIAYLASMITTLYDVKVPQKENTKTTYNVGAISGGTSVNTIAQSAEMLYEYRSDDIECLEKMRVMFNAVVEAYRAMGITVNVELLGERPCGNVDAEKEKALCLKVEDSVRRTMGQEAKYNSGSTDANYPLSKGIPAVCVGSIISVGAHTREEYLPLDSILPAFRFVLDFMSGWFE